MPKKSKDQKEEKKSKVAESVGKMTDEDLNNIEPVEND